MYSTCYIKNNYVWLIPESIGFGVGPEPVLICARLTPESLARLDGSGATHPAVKVHLYKLVS